MYIFLYKSVICRPNIKNHNLITVEIMFERTIIHEVVQLMYGSDDIDIFK